VNEIALTDDEVAALAVEFVGPWPTGMPTVLETDPGAVTAASFRGRRSLVVRGLVDDAGEIDSALLSLCSIIPAGGASILVYLADAAFDLAGWGVLSGHYPSEESWVLETLSPTGIHHVSRVPAIDHCVYLEALLLGAEQAGPETAGSGGREVKSPALLCALARGPGGAVLAAARHGEIVIGGVSLGNERVVPDRALSLTTAHDAVSALVEALGVRVPDRLDVDDLLRSTAVDDIPT
jgi:hypothetical protein